MQEPKLKKKLIKKKSVERVGDSREFSRKQKKITKKNRQQDRMSWKVRGSIQRV